MFTILSGFHDFFHSLYAFFNFRLEASKKKLEEAEKTWKHEREDLLKDQVGLQKLHDNLQQDYEKLMEEKESQKEIEKSLRNDLKKLQSISMNLDEDQEKLMRAKEAIGKIFMIFLLFEFNFGQIRSFIGSILVKLGPFLFQLWSN